MATLQELLDQKVALDRQITDARKSHRALAIAEIRALMETNGLTVADLAASRPPAKKADRTKAADGTTKKVAAKYRNVESGESWTGRGLKPKWLARELENGKSLSDFAV